MLRSIQAAELDTQSATYDNNGNLVTLTDTSGTTTYTWNARDQLVSLSGPGVTASFQYDALGWRKSKTVNGTTTSFLYDGLNVVQELNGTTPTANLLTSLGIGETLLRTDSVGARSFLVDGLGSTLALTDSAGLVQGEYTYEPFGKTTATGAASTNAFKYTGREDDGTGLYYYRARYYHPALQRFISEDPIGFDGGDVNLYGYVGNSPVNFYDPEGENAAAAAGAIAEGAAQGAGVAIGAGAKIFGGIAGTIVDLIFPYPAGDAADMCYLSSGRPRGFLPGDKGGEEWGKRTGVGRDEGRRRFHEEKKRDKGRPRDDYSVNPDTGDVANPGGEVVGNLND